MFIEARHHYRLFGSYAASRWSVLECVIGKFYNHFFHYVLHTEEIIFATEEKPKQLQGLTIIKS